MGMGILTDFPAWPAHAIRMIFTVTCLVSAASAQSVTTTGYSGSLTIGTARADPVIASRPSVISILSSRQQNILAAETAFTGASALQRGRVPIEVQGPINTGLAFGNVNDTTVPVSFVVADAAGVPVGNGSFTLPAHGQLARF